MTHKYDVQQFGKILDEYNTADELKVIRAHLNLEDKESNESPSPMGDVTTPPTNEESK